MVSSAAAFVWGSSGPVDTVLYFEPAPDDATVGVPGAPPLALLLLRRDDLV
jgi:hypothetical protein